MNKSMYIMSDLIELSGGPKRDTSFLFKAAW
jgi:hypothetical protein